MRAERFLLLAVLAAVVPFALAAENEADQRRRIAAERSVAQARFEQRQRECHEGFVVSPCVDAARREQRDVLARLRREEAALDERLRHERAAQRAAHSGSRPAAAADDAASVAAPGPRRPAAPLEPAPSQVRAHSAKAPKLSAEAQRETEARNQAKFEASKKAAQEHRDTVDKRNAERAAAGKGAKPLPLPGGASAP